MLINTLFPSFCVT
uniref:Uncharacterized protein n=1 Tax=Arundo donax TaxID=35708 RepID=A0A0A9BGJ5_ARUDO